MHAPAVKGVVVPELPLQNRDGPEADETGDKTNEEGGERFHKARPRGDADKTRDRA